MVYLWKIVVNILPHALRENVKAQDSLCSLPGKTQNCMDKT